MDLETFVANSLVEVAAGIRSANKAIGAAWKADGVENVPATFFMLVPKSTAADRTVEFDVAVTASTTREVGASGKGRILIAEASLDGKAEFAQERVSRVKFRVHVDFGIT